MSIATEEMASPAKNRLRIFSIGPEKCSLFLWRLVTLAAALGIAQLLSWVVPIMPRPLAIFSAIGRLLGDSDTYWNFGVTLFEALSGIAIATFLGVSLGVLIGLNRTASDFLSPIIMAIYAVPKIVFLPILMIILGTGLGPKIGNAAFHAIFPILLNTVTGMQGVSALHKKVARSMFASPRQMLFRIYLPSMVLPVFVGLQLAVGLAVLGAVLAELFEAKAGAGHAVMEFYEKGQMPEMVAIVVLMLVLIVWINWTMSLVERRLSRWRNSR